MLEKQTFKDGIEKLIIFFPTWKFDVTSRRSLKLWYEQFEDYTDKEFMKGVDKFINGSGFSPTIKALKDFMKVDRILKMPETVWEEEEEY